MIMKYTKNVNGVVMSCSPEEVIEFKRLEKTHTIEQAAQVLTKYARDRAEAYPPVTDQLDMIYHAGLGGDEFQSAIQAVKDAHPKGGN